MFRNIQIHQPRRCQIDHELRGAINAELLRLFLTIQNYDGQLRWNKDTSRKM
jgi:hypothetical protein